MCGIAGIWDFRQNLGFEEVGSIATRMSRSLFHRGPDDSGLVQFSNVGLALSHQRLSIIDVSSQGRQPMTSSCGRCVIVYNGEIYNQRELRAELIAGGHEFASETDTEVIVHLYEEYGSGCVEHLNGMFAFAIWNKRTGSGLIARDRLGIKPLYYTLIDGTLVFASELKAILAFPGVETHVAAESLDLFLTLRYVPENHTILKGIEKLPPAQILEFDSHAQICEKKEYWSPVPSGREATRGRPVGDLADELFDLLRDSVKIRLMSDVPFGAFLSGGLDSSTVVALMSELMEDRVKTFAIGFSEDAKLDERRYSELVAESRSTEHYTVDCTAPEVENLPRLMFHFDEPFADPIVVPFYQVSKLAAEHVKVVLTGEGADEVFGGYTRYVNDGFVRRLRPLPDSLKKGIEMAAGTIPFGGIGEQIRQAIQMTQLPDHVRFLRWVTAFSTAERRDLYQPHFKDLVADGAEEMYKRYVEECPAVSSTNKMMYCELRSRLPECMLARTDRMTMAVSLEARTPFLDHRIVEWVAQLPADLKVRGRNEKYLLKRAVRPLLPESISARKKQGLAVPFALWTRYGIDKPIKRILTTDL